MSQSGKKRKLPVAVPGQRSLLSVWGPAAKTKPKETCVTDSDSASDTDEPTQAETSAPGSAQPRSTEPMTVSDDHDNTPDPDTAKPATQRKFQEKWLKLYPWLTADESRTAMKCKLCIEQKKRNTFTEPEGNSNLRTTTLDRHAAGGDHRAAIAAGNMQGDLRKAINKALSEKEKAVIVGLKAVYWLAKEQLPLHKYDSLMNLLIHLECPHIQKLKVSKATDYTSERSSNDMLNSLATCIRKQVDNQLLKSPFLSILADESTDISVTKNLVVFARVLDPDTFKASTHFLHNVKVKNGKAVVITQTLRDLLNDKQVDISKVMALGGDGATALTSKKAGVTGLLLRINPMLINYHCIAHRLALVTSQAAKDVTYLAKYQDTLTSIFYYFKASAVRTDALKAIQLVLDEPQLKVREVHDVRWMAIFNAVASVFRTLDSLITYLHNESNSNAKAKGLLKKLTEKNFVATTYLLMDVLDVTGRLCLEFQKKNLDICMAQVCCDLCRFHTSLTLCHTGYAVCENIF